MAVLRLPQVDPDALRDVVRDLSRDLDLSRLTALRDDLRSHRPAERRRPAPRAGTGWTCRAPSDRATGSCACTTVRARTLPDVGKLSVVRARVVLPPSGARRIALLAGACGWRVARWWPVPSRGGVLAWLLQPGSSTALARGRSGAGSHRLQRRASSTAGSGPAADGRR